MQSDYSTKFASLRKSTYVASEVRTDTAFTAFSIIVWAHFIYDSLDSSSSLKEILVTVLCRFGKTIHARLRILSLVK